MKCKEGFNRLLTSRFNESTGVDHDQIGLSHLLGVDELVVLQQFYQCFGINLVLGTTKILHIYFFHEVLLNDLLYRVAD